MNSRSFFRLARLVMLFSSLWAMESRAAAPRLTTPVHPNRAVEFTVQGDVGAEYSVEGSRDLSSWFVISSGVATNGFFTVRHDGAVGDSTLFYRARLGTAAPQGFKLYPARLSMTIGDVGGLLALVRAGEVNWSSSDPAVVTVTTNGFVKAISKGTAVITASSGGSSATSAVTIYNTSGLTPDAETRTLIAAAFAANQITSEQELMYRVFALFGDDRLPVQFRGAPSSGADHLVLREVAGRLAGLSPAVQIILRPFLLPPIYEESWIARELGLAALASPPPPGMKAMDVTPNCSAAALKELWPMRSTAHFNIHYFGLGTDAHTLKAVDLIASVVEEVYAAETALFQRFPMPDLAEACNGGDGALDIYLVPSFANYGALGAVTTYPGRCENVPSYITINSLSGQLLAAAMHPPDLAGKARSLVKSILAHEFLHVLQFTLDRQADCQDYEWLDEATANWAMHFVDPEFNAEDGQEKWTRIGSAADNSLRATFSMVTCRKSNSRGMEKPPA